MAAATSGDNRNRICSAIAMLSSRCKPSTLVSSRSIEADQSCSPSVTRKSRDVTRIRVRSSRSELMTTKSTPILPPISAIESVGSTQGARRDADDSQVVEIDLRERSARVLGEAGSEVGELVVACEILERQHCDSRGFGLRVHGEPREERPRSRAATRATQRSTTVPIGARAACSRPSRVSARRCSGRRFSLRLPDSRDGPDRCDEPIASTRHRLDERRILGGIAESGAHLAHERIEAGIEIDDDLRRPERRDDLLARHHAARAA